MADQFTVYQPSPGAYVGFGISEGLRKHVEFMERKRNEDLRHQQFQQGLDQQMKLAQMDVVSRADELAQREQALNKDAAQQQAQLEFQKEKFKEEKKQWETEWPTRKKYLESGGEAKLTTASAAVTRANRPPAGGKGTEMYTPAGVSKKYAETYSKQFETAAKAYAGADFTNIYTDPEAFQNVKDQARAATREAMTPWLNSYNSYVEDNPMSGAMGHSVLSWDDLEALPGVRKAEEENPVTVKAAKDFNALNADPTFTSRFETLALTDREIDLLRLNAEDLYVAYKDLIKQKGGKKLVSKMDSDKAIERNKALIEKNIDKR